MASACSCIESRAWRKSMTNEDLQDSPSLLAMGARNPLILALRQEGKAAAVAVRSGIVLKPLPSLFLNTIRSNGHHN